jgi:hypothetical protein
VGSGVVAGAVGAIVMVGVVVVAWVVGGGTEALESQPVIRRTQLSKITTRATIVRYLDIGWFLSWYLDWRSHVSSVTTLQI